MDEIEERVKSIVINRLGVEAQGVVEQAFFVDLGARSMDMVELAMDFEEAFGIEIPFDDAQYIRTIGDAVEFIAKAQASGVSLERWRASRYFSPRGGQDE